MNFTTISFTINASAYLTGNVSSNLPFVLFVTESLWVGHAECYAMNVIGCGLFGPFPILGDYWQATAHADLSNLSFENRTTYPLSPGNWVIVIGSAIYPPSVNLVTVASTIAYSV
jgi:hypothetical protein